MLRWNGVGKGRIQGVEGRKPFKLLASSIKHKISGTPKAVVVFDTNHESYNLDLQYFIATPAVPGLGLEQSKAYSLDLAREPGASSDPKA